MDRSRLIQDLHGIVGHDGVLFAPEDLLVYEYDGSIDRGLPDLVVLPRSAEEAARIVRLAAEAGLPVVPRGAGTGLSGGAVAAQGGIAVGFARMRRILEVDAVNRLAVVEPGVVNLDLSRAVAHLGLYYVPDPSSQRACTLGGNVAENSGGPHCLAYGVTTNHVLGLEVVLADGTITWLGGSTAEAPGYDLRGAFIGSEGTLGIVTKIVVRLLPLPEATITTLAVFDELDDASRAVSAIIGRGILPAALEMMDRTTLAAVAPTVPADYPPDAGAVLLIEVDGLREEVAEQARMVEEVCREAGARELRRAEDAAGRERLWSGRKGAIGALGRLAPNYYILDGVVPRTRLPEVLRAVGQIVERHELQVANVFHAGDGNLHPCVLFDEREPGATERVLAAGAEIMRLCLDAGGAITGEHGVGLEKREFLAWTYSDDDLRVMQQLRAAFQATERFNPGKVFPSGVACGEALAGPRRFPQGAGGLPDGLWV
ncbi:MAG: FAD-binding protein [Chloroflexi bacterium]|nr:FAD-binding protein [Chloroflexota bacterium]